ncbi:MAG: hypothetical protein P1P87_13485, partial [Trueperaceae bacterium]|nr:hypothetical protein [Trueperaceae bacterium]
MTARTRPASLAPWATTAVDPEAIYDALTGEGEWLIVEDAYGERHYLSVRSISYLTFDTRKGIG